MATEPNKLTEAKLVAGLRHQDQAVFRYLYTHYSAALYGCILPIVQQEDLAGEVLQDVFLKIWQNIGHYDESKARLFTWMARIARNAAIDAKRRQQQKKQQPNQSQAELDDQAHSLEPFIEGIGLDKLLAELQEEQRQVLQLLYYQGYTQVETAEKLQIPLGTVKSRLRLAIIKLRNYFQ